MFNEKHFYTSPKFWTTIFVWGLLISFFITYWNEWILIWQLAVAYLLLLVYRLPVILPLNPETFRALLVVGVNIAIAILGYLLTILWISQFTLPVSAVGERWKAFKHLFWYAMPFHSHGAAIFVKDGRLVATKEELDEPEAGVAFVDLSSAVVLEQQWGEIETDVPDIRFTENTEDFKNTSSLKPSFFLRILKAFGLSKGMKKITIVRAKGPGVVFTDSGEKIIGWADLRKQIRFHEKVKATTRDGIEVETKITVMFTLGEPPEILNVVQKDGDWKVVQLEEDNSIVEPTNIVFKRQIIKGFDVNTLNEFDKVIINDYLEKHNFNWLVKYHAVTKQINASSSPPFGFDAQRVFNAVYSRARDAREGILGEWTDLPVYAAIDVFRNMLIHETFDRFYKPNDPNDSKDYPLKDFKNSFSLEVRKGSMLFQIVRRKDGRPLIDGQVWDESDLVFSPAQYLQPNALLSGRGIKVISAGFSGLFPVSDIIRRQFLDNWKAHWQQATEKTMASHELQATRIRNHERAKAQQDMIYSLSQIFQGNEHTNEALAMRLYQALEAAATNPATQRLLPRDTINMLWNLREWLLPDQPKNDKGNSHGGNGNFVDGEELSADVVE
jgi:hypothetical protein